jgi:hypothetical protein
MTANGERVPVRAIEVPPEEAAVILRRTLAPYQRSRLARMLLGPQVRPPAGILRRFHVRVDDTLEDHEEEARRHPLFELLPKG